VPGEKTSPTQPFPTKPAAFDRQGITLADLIDFTPALKAEAVKIASEYKLGPLYTPAIVAGSNGLKGTLILPSTFGGANWQGGAVDPETGVMYVGSVTSPVAISLKKATSKDSSGEDYQGSIAGFTDPRRPGCGGMGPQGLPLVKPPWGRITAIDLNTGDHLWMVPNGDTPDCVKNHPALKGVAIPKTGVTERPGLLLTKTLLFAGEGAGIRGSTGPGGGGPMFRAYDKKTGEPVWEFKLPGHQTGNPMTYLVDGKQFIVVAVGEQNQPAELVALALS
jgi:quinoprotein glucose dehydrogenase